MAIRRADLEDAEAIAEACSAAWRWAYQGIVTEEMLARQEPRALADRIREQWNPDRLYLVSTDQKGSVVGFAMAQVPPALQGYDAEIQALYVHPDHARGGHGRLLVIAMAREFLEQGHRSLCIHTLRENRIGRGFYKKLGGSLVHEDDWRGLPSVWYAWPDMDELIASETGKEHPA